MNLGEVKEKLDILKNYRSCSLYGIGRIGLKWAVVGGLTTVGGVVAHGVGVKEGMEVAEVGFPVYILGGIALSALVHEGGIRSNYPDDDL